jgi:hypothetical protein
MTNRGYRLTIGALSSVVILLAGLSAWLFLRGIPVVLADAHAEALEEMREHALSQTSASDVAATLRHASRWYGTITPTPSETPEARLLRRVRIGIVRDIIAHLRELTGKDLGADPKPWIEVYAPSE